MKCFVTVLKPFVLIWMFSSEFNLLLLCKTTKTSLHFFVNIFILQVEFQIHYMRFWLLYSCKTNKTWLIVRKWKAFKMHIVRWDQTVASWQTNARTNYVYLRKPRKQTIRKIFPSLIPNGSCKLSEDNVCLELFTSSPV